MWEVDEDHSTYGIGTIRGHNIGFNVRGFTLTGQLRKNHSYAPPAKQNHFQQLMLI